MPDERPEGRGSFAADIAEEAIAAALRAVEQAKREHAPAADPAPGPAADAVPPVEGEEIAVEPEAKAGPTEALSARIAALEEELAEKDRLLEESMRRGRETMDRLKDANDRMLRSAADLENYRKRAQREKEEVQKFGVEGLLRDLLPVLDNFDRALEAAPSCTDVASFASGVSMTRRLFEDTLGRFGVKSFRALGETFDPRLHEAVQGIESHEHPANVVVQEIVRGFLLHDRLVRPSMVVVSRGPGPAPVEPAQPVEAKPEEPAKAEASPGPDAPAAAPEAKGDGVASS
jgi:molecular chaperone GrpE